MKNTFKNKKNLIVYLAVLLVACLLPLFFGGSSYIFSLVNLMLIYTISASGLDILFGYSGLISLGHAGFYALGAYGSALLSSLLNVPVIISMFLGAILACLVGLALAYPASKLKGHFLALVTIAFGEIIYLLLCHSPKGITGDFSGFYGIPALNLFGLKIKENWQYFYVLLFFVVVTMFVKHRIVKSRVGRAFVAIRDNHDAAIGMGINIRKYRIMAFGISAFITGFAGALYAHMIRFVSPETFTMNNISVPLVTIVLFGGMASQWGPAIGAVVVTLVGEILQLTGTYQMILYGLFVVIVLLFMPQGIMATVKELFDRIMRSKKVKKAVSTSAEN